LTGGWDLIPVVWSEGGGRIYAMKAGTGIVHSVELKSGKVEERIRLPLESADHKMLTMSADGRFVLYNHIDIRRDLWLVEDFDPELE
jgi:hypothetical protein